MTYFTCKSGVGPTPDVICNANKLLDYYTVLDYYMACDGFAHGLGPRATLLWRLNIN